MSKYFKVRYRCPKCLEIYDTGRVINLQFMCCGEHVRRIYECGDCGIRHTTLEDAKECCQAAE